MNKCIYIAVVLLMSVLLSCKQSLENSHSDLASQGSDPKMLSAMDYLRWIENKENGLVKRKDIGEYYFELQYKPLEYVALQAFQEESYTAEEIKTEIEANKDMQYFTLKIGTVSGTESPLNKGGDAYSRVEYFSFKIQNCFTLIDGNDTLPCLLSHFERTYELTPYNTFVLAFSNPNPGEEINNDLKFIYNDDVLGTGKANIIIEAENINRVPKLKI
jgi:hypothetical protein